MATPLETAEGFLNSISIQAQKIKQQLQPGPVNEPPGPVADEILESLCKDFQEIDLSLSTLLGQLEDGII